VTDSSRPDLVDSSTSDLYITAKQGDAWAADAASRGRAGTQQLLGVEVVEPDGQIRTALHLGADGRAVVRRRLIVEDDAPVELADSYYPEKLAAGTALAEAKKIRGGAMKILADLGHAPRHVREHVTARHPTPEEATTLGVAESEPLLVLTRLSQDATGQPVEYAIMLTVARRSPGLVYQTQVPEA
jgi:DNA-binding GntR family transcriptional regulator